MWQGTIQAISQITDDRTGIFLVFGYDTPILRRSNPPQSKMAKNLKFFFDGDGIPRARGPSSESILMTFLEVDVQGSDFVCHDLMDDITAVEDKSADLREFNGNAHTVVIYPEGVIIESLEVEPLQKYETGLKHFREILEDWEAFILGDQDIQSDT